MTGTKTNIVTAVIILDKNANEFCPRLPPLVNATAKAFTVNEVCADKAYTSVENFEAVAALGGTLYAPFKTNHTGLLVACSEKMFAQFMLYRKGLPEALSASGRTWSPPFSSYRRKFGDSVQRNKSDKAMENEALCKILSHNICCYISAWYELWHRTGVRRGGMTAPRDVLSVPNVGLMITFLTAPSLLRYNSLIGTAGVATGGLDTCSCGSYPSQNGCGPARQG